VLDAPALKDDYYLNLLDWSSSNILAVGLASNIYLWSASTSRVTKLADLGSDNSVASIQWSKRGTSIGIGTNDGFCQIWDVVKCKMIRNYAGHTNRVGSLAWSTNLLASGSRDKSILLRDIRTKDSFISHLIGHKQEVCGLKWAFGEQQLASGGNDNKLLVWNASRAEIP
jgi:cell division cycle 20-like protein 1 (cofactor of APC complex)